MTTIIKLDVGYENITNDVSGYEFTFTGDATSKTAIEKGIAHFMVFSEEFAAGWQFVNWKAPGKQGTIFNTTV